MTKKEPVRSCKGLLLMGKRVYFSIICVWGLFLLSIHTLNGQECPPEGRKKPGKGELTQEEKEFNKRKNKSAKKPTVKPEVISINSLKSGRKAKDDRDAWWEGAYVEINDAYLIDYKEQGGETCNCYEADDDPEHLKGDVHINLGNKRDLQDEDNNYYVVVEITPDYKLRQPDYAEQLKRLKGKKVVVRGYLFYDSEHEHNSINYCQTCSEKGVWRKTCWEVHPVTYISSSP